MKTRREFLGSIAALGALGLPGCASTAGAGAESEPAKPHERDEIVIRNAYVMTMDARTGDLPGAECTWDGVIVAVGRPSGRRARLSTAAG